MSAAAKRVVPGNADVSIYDIMARCALSEPDEIELQRYVESKGMIFISTPFSHFKVCQIVSVTNGAKGCASFKIVSRP